MRALRGNEISMIFQDPLSSLHPFYTIGDQLVEAVRAHRDVSKAQALDRAVEMLGLVGIPEPRKRADGYPHEFSGGMRQRVMIAMALINDPKLLIADEPTTALDVTVQAQILDLIERLQRELDTAIVLITHDLGRGRRGRRRHRVMYAGKIVERGRRTRSSHARSTRTPGGCCSRSRGSTRRAATRSCRSPGRPPSLINRPHGCAFHPRCPYVQRGPQAHRAAAHASCRAMPGHSVACLLPDAQRGALWQQLAGGATPGGGARRRSASRARARRWSPRGRRPDERRATPDRGHATSSSTSR